MWVTGQYESKDSRPVTQACVAFLVADVDGDTTCASRAYCLRLFITAGPANWLRQQLVQQQTLQSIQTISTGCSF